MPERLEIEHARALVDLKYAELEQARRALIEEHKKDLVKINRQDLFDMLKNNKLKHPDHYSSEPGMIQVLSPCDYEDFRTEYTSYVCLNKKADDLVAGGYLWSSSDRFRSFDYVYIWYDHRSWR